MNGSSVVRRPPTCEVRDRALCENGSVASSGHDDQVADAQRRRLRLHPTFSRRAQLASLFFLSGAVFLVPWTIFLGLTLPPKYDAHHWSVLWTGFDVALIAVLLLAAWAARYRRQILAAIIIVAGTLLICDAWFDMVTSFGSRDDWLTLLTGFGGELPLGIFFFWLSHRMIMNTLTALHRETSDSPRPRRLRDFTIVEWEKEVLGLTENDGSRDDPHDGTEERP